MSYDNIKSLTTDEPLKNKSDSNGTSRSSIKSLLSRTFHTHSSNSTSNENQSNDPNKSEFKPKKRRTSFRQFSQFLKRSHSTNTDLSTIATSHTSKNVNQRSNQATADLIYQRLHAKLHDDTDSSFITRSNTSIMCNTSGTALVPISEEENPIPSKTTSQLKSNNIDEGDFYYDNATRSESSGLTYQQTQRIAPSLSKKKRQILLLTDTDIHMTFVSLCIDWRFVVVVVIHFSEYVITIRCFIDFEQIP